LEIGRSYEGEMSTARIVARNSILAFAGQLALRLIQLATTAVLARVLGTAGFGDYGYLVAVLTGFHQLGEFGVDKIVLRKIAQEPSSAPRLVGAALTLKALLSAAAAGLAALFLFALAPTPRLAWLGALACLTLPLNLSALYPAYFQAVLRMGKASWLVAVQGLITSVLLLAAALLPSALRGLEHLRLEFVVGAMMVAPLPSLVVSAWIARSDLRPRLAADRVIWAGLLRQAAPLAFNMVCILVSLRADQIILRTLKGSQALAFYSAGLNIHNAFVIVPFVLLLSAFPLMARFHRIASERLFATAAYSYKILSIFVLPVALAVTLLAEPIVGLLFGDPYLPAARPTAILIWSLFFSFGSIVTFDAVTAAGEQRALVGISLFTMVVNLSLNFLLIPRHGPTGAAVATLISSASGFPILAYLPQTRPLVARFVAASWRPLLATAVLASAGENDPSRRYAPEGFSSCSEKPSGA
jgi:O-antigen/teichoic acid export membrane protein